jgi:hypothetical protein
MCRKQSGHVLLVADQEDSRDGTLELGDRRHCLRDVSVCVRARFFVVLFCRLFFRRGRSWGSYPTFLDMGVFRSHFDVKIEGWTRANEMRYGTSSARGRRVVARICACSRRCVVGFQSPRNGNGPIVDGSSLLSSGADPTFLRFRVEKAWT